MRPSLDLRQILGNSAGVPQHDEGLFFQDVVPTGVIPTRWVFVLHGILGQGGNLRTLARRWIAHRNDTGAVLIDIRNHGRSLHLAPPDDLTACALDLELLGRKPAAVLGHSFGGKVAAKYAERAHARGEPLDSLWILDSTLGPKRPEEIDSHPGSTQAIVESLRALPARFDNREWFAETLEGQGLAPSIVGWLAMSVRSDPAGGYRFGPDVDRIRAMLESYFAEDLWPVVEVPMARRVHVVVAGKSNTFGEADRKRLHDAQISTDGATQMHLMEESSHWVHVDAADQLDTLLAAD